MSPSKAATKSLLTEQHKQPFASSTHSSAGTTTSPWRSAAAYVAASFVAGPCGSNTSYANRTTTVSCLQDNTHCHGVPLTGTTHAVGQPTHLSRGDCSTFNPRSIAKLVDNHCNAVLVTGIQNVVHQCCFASSKETCIVFSNSGVLGNTLSFPLVAHLSELYP